MPIILNGSNQIIYTASNEHWDRNITNAHSDDTFSIVDFTNVLKQIKFNVNPTTALPGSVTLRVDVGTGDSILNLSSGGGGGTPGGSDTQVQFNDGGSFGGNGGFIYNKTLRSLKVGTTLVASGSQSIALGDSNSALESNDVSIGFQNTSSGGNAFSTGRANTAGGGNSIAGGRDSSTTGARSIAVGHGLVANADDQAVFGAYNVPKGTAGAPDPTDEVFTIGNGDGVGSESTALYVQRDGTIGATTATSQLLIGEQGDLTGDVQGAIRALRKVTDPTAAVSTGIVTQVDATYTASAPGGAIGAEHYTKIKVAAGQTVGALGAVFSPVSRVDAADEGTVDFSIGYVSSLTQGNSATKITNTFATFLAAFSSIDSNPNQIGSMYDFLALPQSIAAGAVTNRYGIFINADSGYTKRNYISGYTQLGGSSFQTPVTDTLDIFGNFMSDGAFQDNSGTDSVSANNRQLLDTSGVDTIDWQNRLFKNTDGDTVVRWDNPDETFEYVNAHIKSTQPGAPTVTVDANAGGGATGSVSNATDIAGKVELVTGTITLVAGTQITVNFNRAYDVAPIVQLTPMNDTAASAAIVMYVTSTTDDFSINFSSASPGTLTYDWFYQVIETQ